MAFLSTPSHLALRSQTTDLHPGSHHHVAQMTLPDREMISTSAAIFDQLTDSLMSTQLHSSMSAHNIAPPSFAAPLTIAGPQFSGALGLHADRRVGSFRRQIALEPLLVNPFLDPSQKIGPTAFSVIRIKNIPYDVTKREIIHFLGRNPKIIENHLMGWPVHIVMERSTSKTMDCFVELQTDQAVYDQIRHHDNLVQSGRHPKLGSRHVHVEISDQDGLLSELFPRAKSIMWEHGSPHVIKNDDPYSTGFKGFFTKEEMVGLVRHAECPQRSPFSINCLQRTFESMISTLYKFPWQASGLYALADRNMLFNTYMSQMYCLVEKVDRNDTKGLDQNLLRDFIFAGMNCPGFGERQKHELVTAAGYFGGGVRISPLACCWPFDVLARKDCVDDGTTKFYLELIERGVVLSGENAMLKEYFNVRPRFTTNPPLQNPYFLNNTHFHFNEESQGLDFATVASIEMTLMHELLAIGHDDYQKGCGHWPEDLSSGHQRRLASNVQELQRQQQEILRGDFEETFPRAYYSPPQSPKGILAPSVDTKSQTSVPIGTSLSKPIDPTSKPFQPQRRLSEPRQMPGMLAEGLMYSPLNRRGSESLSLRIPDVFPNTSNSPLRKEYTTPTKGRSRPRVSVGNTIREEDDEDLFMAINHTNQNKVE